jgi:DNA-binding NtrC family response regulator
MFACCSMDDQGDSILVGESVAVHRLRSQIQRIAPYFRTALIRGENGSGKEQVARAIHALSPVGHGPFIVAHAGALAESARSDEAGSAATAASLLASAKGGTLYIKGLGELSIGLQGALFHFLRDREQPRAEQRRVKFERPQKRETETRILAASHRDVRTLSAIGQFRPDLYGRLAAVEILVPPLRERIEDIPILAGRMLGRLVKERGQSAKVLAEETLVLMQARLWPNNLRELARVVAQAAALAEDAIIEPRHLLALVDPAATPAVRMERLHDVIQHHVFDVLTRCEGNKLRAAVLLGISRSTLYRMLDAGIRDINQ